MKRLLAAILSASLASSGCGMTAVRMGSRASVAARPSARDAAPQGVPRDYAGQLPVGARVRVSVAGGRSFIATFMGVEGDAIRVQARTRIPEAPVVIPLADVVELRLDQNGASMAKAILVGAGVGAATFFGILLTLLVAYHD